MRVIFGFEVLVDNVCDPDLDYLEFKPEIKKLFETEKTQSGGGIGKTQPQQGVEVKETHTGSNPVLTAKFKRHGKGFKLLEKQL